jgi:hypothetical protein
VEDRGAEAAVERILDPLGLEPVRAQGFQLDGQLVAFLVVGGEPQAAGAPERVACELLEPVERRLRLPPEPDRAVAADRLERDVVGRSAASKREAAVPAARASGDLTGVVEPDLQARLGEPERRGAAGDAAADDRDVGWAAEPPNGDRRRRLVQPVGGQLSREVARRIGTKARLPTSFVPRTVL